MPERSIIFPNRSISTTLLQAVAQSVKRRRSDAAAHIEPPVENMPLIGRSVAMQSVYRMVARVLRNDLNVLITGESGTGKELVAEAIHQFGQRSSGPFIAVNAAAIPRDLIESEMFGHEKGAFTGAVARSIGKFEQADGGTLFLDEIGDMPIEAQSKLLRTLQSGKIRRVGGQGDLPIDVRIVAATNRDLMPMIDQGLFREDLYYRLNVVPIQLPPLRDRRDDIAALTDHFLALAAEEGLPKRGISAAAMTSLTDRAWRGNIRELRNVVYRLALLCRDTTISIDDLPEALGDISAAPVADSVSDLTEAFERWRVSTRPEAGSLYRTAISAFEKPVLEHALRVSNGNQVQAAQLLGMNRNTLRKRIADLGIAASPIVHH